MKRLLRSAWRFVVRWQWVFFVGLTVVAVIDGRAFSAAIWGVLAGIEMASFELHPKPKGRIEVTTNGKRFTAEIAGWTEDDWAVIDKAYGGTD